MHHSSFNHSLRKQCLGCSQIWGIMKKAPVNSHEWFVVWTCFQPLGVQRAEWQYWGSCTSVFSFVGSRQTTFKSDCPIFHSHWQRMRVPAAPTCARAGALCPGHAYGCVWQLRGLMGGSHCGFSLPFPGGLCCGASSHLLFAICVSSVVRCLLRSLVHCLNWVVFLLLSFRSFCIFWITDLCLLKIFFPNL